MAVLTDEQLSMLDPNSVADALPDPWDDEEGELIIPPHDFCQTVGCRRCKFAMDNTCEEEHVF